MEMLDALMQEPAGGTNHGRRYSEVLPPADGGSAGEFSHPLDVEGWQSEELMRGGGWSVLEGTAHRGVLAPGEYVDPFAIRELVCAELGFTYEQLRSVYRPGRMSAEQVQLRSSIDVALLDVSRDGGNMTQLAEAIGFDDNVIKSALTRARKEQN